ncbi:hypothetical protein D3C86_2023770 [compost metagenome]
MPDCQACSRSPRIFSAAFSSSGASSRVSSLATNPVVIGKPHAQATRWLIHGRVSRCHLRVLIEPMLLGIVVTDNKPPSAR